MIEEIELRLASGEVLPLGPDALVLGRPNVQDWGAGAWVSKEQVKLSLSAYDSGSVRIESIGQNRTGVYTDKWRWLTKGDVCYVTSDTVLSLHAEKHASAQVGRKFRRAHATWRVSVIATRELTLGDTQQKHMLLHM